MLEAVKIEDPERIEEDQPDQDINLQCSHGFWLHEVHTTLVVLK